MLTLQVSRMIKTSVPNALDLFWDVGHLQVAWPSIISHDVLYHAPTHQELWMAVRRDDAREDIRIVRFRRTNSIEFFNPVPPPQMSVHRGEWHVAAHRANEVELTARREFSFRVAPERGQAYQLDFISRFRSRLQAILDNAALVLEAASPNTLVEGDYHGHEQ